MNAPDMRARLASAVHVLTALTRRVRPDGTLLESLDELALDGVLRSLTAVLAASRAHGLSVNVRGAGDVVRALDGLPGGAPAVTPGAPLATHLTCAVCGETDDRGNFERWTWTPTNGALPLPVCRGACWRVYQGAAANPRGVAVRPEVEAELDAQIVAERVGKEAAR